MEVLISIFLISIVFWGILGGFQLSIRVSSQTKAKMQGVYLANQMIEELRNLPYSDIETTQDEITINGVDYGLQTIVENFDDCADGTIEGIDCNNQVVTMDLAPDDYKKIKVIVSWEDFFGGELVLSSYIASKSMETGEGKGAIRINLVNSLGQSQEILTGDQLAPCSSSSINIINDNYFFDQCYGTDITNIGSRLLILDESIEPDDYKIIITKDGYAREETFQSGDIYNGIEISTPSRKNPTINEGELYPITFIIDETSGLDITTAITWGGDSFSDTFLDQGKISIVNDLVVEDGQVTLGHITPIIHYALGYMESSEIIPSAITQWHDFRFEDFEDVDTDISYQIYFATTTVWNLIPEQDLPGNNVGFDSSPVSLSGLNIIDYPKLKIRAEFVTSDNIKTPVLYDWQITWKDGYSTLLSDVNFDVRGDKIIGTDASEQPIYKYSNNLATNTSGNLSFTELDTDNYYFSNFSRYGNPLDLNTLLSPMPFTLLAGEITNTILYLESDNSLLVRVFDDETLLPLFGVELNLTKLDYDQVLDTNNLGEAVFIPLEASLNYSLNIQLPDYYEQDIPISITGDNLQEIYLERYE